MAVSVQVLDRGAAAKLKAGEASLRDVRAVAGRVGQNSVRANFFRLEREHPNKEGWARQHLWAQMARGTSNRVVADGAIVTVSHVAARQRWQGGTIVPKNGKYLTLPAREEAYGKRAREFALKFAIATDPKDGRERPALVDEVGETFYWLIRRAVQQPDPTVLPSEAELRRDVTAGIDQFLRIQARRNGT